MFAGCWGYGSLVTWQKEPMTLYHVQNHGSQEVLSNVSVVHYLVKMW